MLIVNTCVSNEGSERSSAPSSAPKSKVGYLAIGLEIPGSCDYIHPLFFAPLGGLSTWDEVGNDEA
jgi:hypothetical protein